MKIENEVALVPLHSDFYPVRSVSAIEIVDYGSYNRNRSGKVFSENWDRSSAGNYNNFGSNEKEPNSLGENVDIYV